LVRFFTVGWMGFVVQMAASVALTSVVHVSWLPATGAAAELSIIRNFFWHGLVFMPGITIERTPDSLRTYLRLVRKTIVTMTYDTMRARLTRVRGSASLHFEAGRQLLTGP